MTPYSTPLKIFFWLEVLQQLISEEQLLKTLDILEVFQNLENAVTLSLTGSSLAIPNPSRKCKRQKLIGREETSGLLEFFSIFKLSLKTMNR